MKSLEQRAHEAFCEKNFETFNAWRSVVTDEEWRAWRRVALSVADACNETELQALYHAECTARQEVERSKWEPLRAVARALGYERADAVDFGEVDEVEVVQLASKAAASSTTAAERAERAIWEALLDVARTLGVGVVLVEDGDALGLAKELQTYAQQISDADAPVRQPSDAEVTLARALAQASLCIGEGEVERAYSAALTAYGLAREMVRAADVTPSHYPHEPGEWAQRLSVHSRTVERDGVPGARIVRVLHGPDMLRGLLADLHRFIAMHAGEVPSSAGGVPWPMHDPECRCGLCVAAVDSETELAVARGVPAIEARRAAAAVVKAEKLEFEVSTVRELVASCLARISEAERERDKYRGQSKQLRDDAEYWENRWADLASDNGRLGAGVTVGWFGFELSLRRVRRAVKP